MTAGTRDLRTDVAAGVGAAGRPVLLARSACLDEAASVLRRHRRRVGPAARVGQPHDPAPPSDVLVLGYDTLPSSRPMSRRPPSLRRAARSLGVHVERLREEPRPVEALLELVTNCVPGLLVFGPDRSAMRAVAIDGPFGPAGSG